MSNYLGLDIGTNSVGWALVDDEHQIVRKNNFSLWGVRMFDEARDAKERRGYRNSRRRLERRKFRISLLQNEFDGAINKIDPYFFERLRTSFFKLEDKSLKNTYIFFDDNYTDKVFFNEYPTIFHLRKALINDDHKFDLRMIYLAIHHIVKYRGNFLYAGDEFNKKNSKEIQKFFDNLNSALMEMEGEEEDDRDYFGKIEVEEDSSFLASFESIMTKQISISDRKRALKDLFKVSNKTLVNELFIPLLAGSTVNISNLAYVKDLKYEPQKINLNDEGLEEKVSNLKSNIKELSLAYDLIIDTKHVLDYYYLINLLGSNCNYLSEAMVNIYEVHAKELTQLKKLIKEYDKQNGTKYYNECFRKITENNYPSYIGYNSTEGLLKRFKHCSKDDFYKYLTTLLQTIRTDENETIINEIKTKIDNGNYLLRQNSNQNGSIPMQLHLAELKKILENQAKYYPFLNDIIDGLTVQERIIKIFKYKLPYYIGPLNQSSDKSWVVRKTNEKITPFNIERIVDFDETAKRFIQRMQNKCTYLKGENDFCLPKFSIIYQEYLCLSYLNNLTINKSHITQRLKEYLFENLFLKDPKPTKKKLMDIIKREEGNEIIDPKEILDIPCSMSSYLKFKDLFKEDFEINRDIIEDIIKNITIFEDKSILENRLRSIYKLDEAKIKVIKQLNYTGYGKLSKHFLSELVSINNQTGEEVGPIIVLMRNNVVNMQEILFNEEYNFNQAVDDYNKNCLKKSDANMTVDEFIDEYLYISPGMKRPLIQTLKIIDEIEKIIAPEKIDKYYVECTRKKDKKQQGKVKQSRFNNLKELYEQCKTFTQELNSFNIDINHLEEELNDHENDMQSDRIYLYFTQLGRSMYTLKPIDINQLSAELYDIDHIYPQAIVKDDSISNRVLTEKGINNNKQDTFLCDTTIVTERHRRFYKFLYEKNLITRSKYERLTEKEVSQSKFQTFVNRQIVFTNQAVKGVIEFLKLYKKVDPANVIYARASTVSDFRNKYDLPKSRTANNFHHAHDAYLNVVLGKVVDDYFKYIYKVKNIYQIEYYKNQENKDYTLNPLTILGKDRYIIINNQHKKIWDKDKAIQIINHNLYERFDVHETIKTYHKGNMFEKVTILPAGEGNIPVKTSNNDPRASISKYGGITSKSYCTYVLLKVVNKKEQVEFILEPIPATYKTRIEEYINNEYPQEKYNSILIINDKIPTNVIINQDKTKCVITGITGNSYYIQNYKDRYFNKHSVSIIKKIEKYFDNISFKRKMIYEEDKVIVAVAQNERTKEINITREECNYIFDEIRKIYNKDIYNFSIIQKISSSIRKFNNTVLEMHKYIELINELLKLLKTNERTTANLEQVNLAKTCGTLKINKKLVPGMKFISESITGYYSNVMFEVPK